MNRSLAGRPAVGKAQPSLQQQLASGKKAKAARQAQHAQGKRKAPDAALPVTDAATVGANVAGASHVSASRLLALLRPAAVTPATHEQPPAQTVVHSSAAFNGHNVEPAVVSLPVHTYVAPPHAAVSAISDNRRRQMGSSIFNNDTTAPLPLTTSRNQHSTYTAQPPSIHPPPTSLPQQPTHPPGTFTVAATATPLPQPQSVMATVQNRQSWGGGGRSLEAGDGARDAEWQKKLDMRASLDAQMKEKEERKRQERLQAQAGNGRVQEHWMDTHAIAQSTFIQPPPTASFQHATVSYSANNPPPMEQLTSRTSPITHAAAPLSQTAAPSSSVHRSSIRTHNQSSSVFNTDGNDTTEQRKAQVRHEAQAALRQQMDEKKQRDEEKKRVEAAEERRWEDKLERERRELAGRYVGGGGGVGVVEEERKEVVLTVREAGGEVREEKQQLTVSEVRKEKIEKRRSSSDSRSESDEENADRRRKKSSKDRRASRDRGRRSRRRHSDSDDSGSSYSDSSDRHARRRKSSRQRNRRRERRSRHSSQSEEDDRVADECIYVSDSAYTHRVRYEQEQKEIDHLAHSTSNSRPSKSKANSSASNRSSPSPSAAPPPKPPFGVRSMQSRAQPKAPASRVRAAPPPLPMGDTRAGKQALSAARLAMGRTSGGGDKFVTQKWKEQKKTSKQHTAVHEQPLKAVDGNRDGREIEKVSGGGSGNTSARAVNEVVVSVQELSLADRLDSTSEWLLPHSLGLPSYRG